MAGDSSDMKEQLSVYEDSGDPLATKPPFGGAEAKPQNSDYPDSAPIDINVIAKIVESGTGARYPLDCPWLTPQWFWKETLRIRKDPISKVNNSIHSHYAETMKGKDYDVAIATGFLAKLTSEINQIASSQFDQGYTGPKSWKEVDSEASKILGEKITVILEDKSNTEFFNRNFSINKGLELVRNVLINSNDPDFIYEKHSEYMKGCIEANAKGELIFYIPFESDFTHPVKSENEKTQICEAMVSIMVPMNTSDRTEFDELANSTWDLLKRRKNAHKTNSRLNIIVGANIMGAGFESLDSTVAESFIIKNNDSHEHGFYLALNNLAKKKKFWGASTELLNIRTSNDIDTYNRNLILLYILHEEGHRLFPEHGIYGEVPTDIPAVIKSLKIALNPQLLEVSNKHHEFEIHEVVKAIITEYVSEIVNSVSDKDWFEGHNSNSGNDLYDGYLLSAVVIMNAIADSGIAKVYNEGRIDINLSKDNIFKLFHDLEIVDAKFHEKDKKTLDKISLAVTNPEARKIIELYRNKIKEKQFMSNTSLPLEMSNKANTFMDAHTS